MFATAIITIPKNTAGAHSTTQKCKKYFFQLMNCVQGHNKVSDHGSITALLKSLSS